MGKQRRDLENQRIKGSSLPFEEWIEFIRTEMGSVNWDSDPSDLLDRLTRLFHSADYLYSTYTQEELNKFFWTLLGESGLIVVLYDKELPLDSRLKGVASIKTLYQELFEKHCTQVMLHGLKEHPQDMSPLNSICYMWWDIFPSWGSPVDAQSRKVDEAILELLGDILSSAHLACQESALHGLGHWHLHYPSEVEKIIDRFLSKSRALPEGLKSYALSARCGCVN